MPFFQLANTFRTADLLTRYNQRAITRQDTLKVPETRDMAHPNQTKVFQKRLASLKQPDPFLISKKDDATADNCEG